MEKFPNVDIASDEENHELDIQEDLAVIATEDLKSDPFIRAAPIKPPPPEPTPDVKPVKKKRPVSDKQKTHLANMRKLAKEKRESKKLEPKVEPPKAVEPAVEPIPPPKAVEVVDSQIDGFEQFLGYMDKFQDIKISQQKEIAARKAEEDRKEKEMEAKYFKKFQDQHPGTFKPVKPVKTSTKKIPSKNLDILNQKAPPNDFGMYSDYF